MAEKQIFQAQGQPEEERTIKSDVERIRQALRAEGEALQRQAKQTSVERQTKQKPLKKQGNQEEAQKPNHSGRSLSDLEKSLLWLLKEVRPLTMRETNLDQPDRDTFLRLATTICLGHREFEKHYLTVSSAFSQLIVEGFVNTVNAGYTKGNNWRGAFLEPMIPASQFEGVKPKVQSLLESSQRELITSSVARFVFYFNKGVALKSIDSKTISDLECHGLCFKVSGEIMTVPLFFTGPIPQNALKRAETELRLLQRERFASLSSDERLAGVLLRVVLIKVLRGCPVGKDDAIVLSEADVRLLQDMSIFVSPGQKTVILFEEQLIELLNSHFTKEQKLKILKIGIIGPEVTATQIRLILAKGLEANVATEIPVPLVKGLDGELYLLEDTELALKVRYFEQHRATIELIAFIQKQNQPNTILDTTRRFVSVAAAEMPLLNVGDVFENFSIIAGFQGGLSEEQLCVSIAPPLKVLFQKLYSRVEVGALYLIEKANAAHVSWEVENQAILAMLVDQKILDTLYTNGMISSQKQPEILPWVRDIISKAALAEILTEEDWTIGIKQAIEKQYAALSARERALLQLIIGQPLATSFSLQSTVKDVFASYLAGLGVDQSLYRKLKSLFYIFFSGKRLDSLFELGSFPKLAADPEVWQAITGKTKYDLIGEATDAVKSSGFAEWVTALKGHEHKLNMEPLFRNHVLTCSSDQKVWLTEVGYEVLSEWFMAEQAELVHRLQSKGIPIEGQTTTGRLLRINIGGGKYTLVVTGAVEITSAGETSITIASFNQALKTVTETIDTRTGETIILTGMLVNQYKSVREVNSGIRRYVEHGGTVIDVGKNTVISAIPQVGEIVHSVRETLGHDIEIPMELQGILAELRGVIESRVRKQADQEREQREKQEREKVREVFAFDELMFAVFLGELEVETDAYVVENGIRPFTRLFHGLPGCGKSARIQGELRSLKTGMDKIGKPLVVKEISISRLVDGQVPLVDFCRLYTEDALLRGKNMPYLLVIKDLDALTEKKQVSTAALAESQKVTAVLKDFFRQMFDRHDYQIGVLAEANSLNNIPEALLQFFPHRSVVITPGFSERKEFFKKLQTSELEIRLKAVAGADPESVEKIKDMYGLEISGLETEGLAKATQGFTYRDLSVLARGMRQEMRQADLKGGKTSPLEIAKKYKASLPQFLSIEVPHQVEPPEVSKEVWDKLRRAMLLHVELTEGNPPILTPAVGLPPFSRPARGLLFSGPPGTGKTLLAKYIAATVNQYFIYLTPAEIFNKYVGESEKNLKEVFTFSRELAAAGRKVILFIDELDGFAPSREQSESRAVRSVLSVLLAELDGVQVLTNVTVIGATNKPEDIDDALLRPGRFEEWIQFYPPTVHEAAKIMSSHLLELLPNSPKLADVAAIEHILGQDGIRERIFTPDSLQPYDYYWSGADLVLAMRRSAYQSAISLNTDITELVRGSLEELARKRKQCNRREI